MNGENLKNLESVTMVPPAGKMDEEMRKAVEEFRRNPPPIMVLPRGVETSHEARDPESDVINHCALALERLPPEARGRVLAYLAARFGEGMSERERCASVCDAFAEAWGCEPEECAVAIREGKTPEEIRERMRKARAANKTKESKG